MELFVKEKDTPNEHYFMEQDAYLPTGNESPVTDIIEYCEHAYKLIGSTSGFRLYKNFRAKLAVLFFTKVQIADIANLDQLKWDTLDDDEKMAVSHNMLVPLSFRLQVPNTGLDYWIEESRLYDEENIKARNIVVGRLRAIIFNVCSSVVEAKKIIEEIDQTPTGTEILLDVNNKTTKRIRNKRMLAQYVDGIEGTLEDDPVNGDIVGVKDFVDSRANTPYDGVGLRHKDNALIDTNCGLSTWTEVSDKCLDYFDGKW